MPSATSRKKTVSSAPHRLLCLPKPELQAARATGSAKDPSKINSGPPLPNIALTWTTIGPTCAQQPLATSTTTAATTTPTPMTRLPPNLLQLSSLLPPLPSLFPSPRSSAPGWLSGAFVHVYIMYSLCREPVELRSQRKMIFTSQVTSTRGSLGEQCQRAPPRGA